MAGAVGGCLMSPRASFCVLSRQAAQTDASAPLHFSSSPSLHLMFSAPYVFPFYVLIQLLLKIFYVLDMT